LVRWTRDKKPCAAESITPACLTARLLHHEVRGLLVLAAPALPRQDDSGAWNVLSPAAPNGTQAAQATKQV
jgi:hypothetical protein